MIKSLEYVKISGGQVFRHEIEKLDSNSITITIGDGITQTIEISGDVKTWQTPDYRSWDGFWGWVGTLKKRLGMSEDQAYIALQMPDLSDIEEVFKLPDWVLGEFRQMVTPFNKFSSMWRMEHIKWRVKHSEICGLNQTIAYWDEIIKKFTPKTKGEFKALRAGVSLKNYKEDNVAMITQIKWVKLSQTQLAYFGVLGIISEKISRILEILIGDYSGSHIYEWGRTISEKKMKFLEVVEKFHHKINPKFMWVGYSGVTNLLKSGISPKELGEIIFPGLTTHEYNKVIPKLSQENSWDSDRCLLGIFMREICQKIPEHWYSEIPDISVAKWANRNVNKLEKTRIIYGPGGSVMTMHYHQLLNEITPGMLPKGEFTGWKKIMTALEEKAMIKIRQQLGECVPLPQLKHSEIHGAVRIYNSFQLRDEGESMGHCVGGYINACLRGASYIYHVGPPAPGGSTLEIIRDSYNGNFKIQQQYGFRDCHPSESDKKIAAVLLAAINKSQSKGGDYND